MVERANIHRSTTTSEDELVPPMNLINVEIKARCSNPEVVRIALRNRGARFVGRDHQVDTYFRVPDGRLKLRQGDIENSLIAYRRPDQSGPKSSEVVLAPITRGDEIRAVLERSLGTLVTVDKQREIYYIDNVKFHLDQVRELGSFVEIEACGQPEEDRAMLLAQCREYMDLFGIRKEDLVERSYSDLLMEKWPAARASS
jgi:adenylate cyclase class 2